MSNTSSSAFADTKPHYDILDGLRGVAALTVVCFHLFEAYATSHLDQKINHGYLAVDFFFILSGFVVGYAYDDRWKTMSIKDFLKRRFIRLHPMVVIGAVIGAVLFYFQGCSVWDVSKVSVTALLLATLMNALLIPATPGAEIRGVGEMYPLNGPSWSLFFEYIGNVLYAFFIHRFSTRALSVLVLLAGCALAVFAIWGPLGDVCVGFALTEENMVGGFLRLLFSFSAGLLLSRIFKPVKVRGAFWIGSFSIVILSAVPRIGGSGHLWMNGVYDTICFAVAFPLLVYLGASGKTTDRATTRICKFLGDISYPLYMVHYPFIYLYYAWIKNKNITFVQSLPGAAALVAGSVILAYLCLRLYDEPVRRFLTKHLLPMRHTKKTMMLLLVLCSLPVCADAQSFRRVLERPLNIIRAEWERDNEDNLELNYYNEDYCSYYLYQINDDCYTLKPGKNTIFKRMKNAPYDNSYYKVSRTGYSTTFNYYRGSFLKSFDVNTPYALPVKNGARTAWQTDRRESVRTLQFRMAPGDTVYATRSGTACSTVSPRLLLICHADHTFAAYLSMNENFISPGEVVRTGQPVGVAGPMGVSISFFFLDKNKFDGLAAVGYAYSHFMPVFRTADGDMKLEEKKMYEALVDDNLVMLDMSKREQKKYLKNKKR